MADIDISPTSSTDITDTDSGINEPAAGSDPSNPSPDEQKSDAAPQNAAQPQQAHTASNQPGNMPDQQFQQGQPGQPAIKQPAQSAQGAQGAPTNQGTPDDPAIQHANRFYKFAQALAGGPRYKEIIDANTGQTTRQQVPLSRGDIGMAIAMEAINGAMSGLTQTGPGAEGKAAAAGFQQVAEQRQQADQQQTQQANADFARRIQVVETNQRLRQNALTIGRASQQMNQDYVGQFTSLADQLQKDHPEVVKGLVNYSDFAKYNITTDSAIPYHVIPRLDPQTGKQSEDVHGEPQWDIQYLVVDPSFKADNFLSDDDKAEAAKFRLPGFADSDGNPHNLPQSLPMRLSMALNYKSRIASLKLGDADVQSYYKTMGQDAPDLPGMIQKDPTLVDAMGKFQPLLNATQQNYAKAIGELGAKDPQAAGKILSLYGGTAMVNKFDQQKIDLEEKAKKDADAQAALDKQKLLAPGEVQIADAKERHRVQIENAAAPGKAYATEASRLQGEYDTKKKNGIPLTNQSGSIADMVKDPNVHGIPVDPNEAKTSNGVNTTYLQKLQQANPDLASVIQAIGEGKEMQSKYGLAKNDGQVLGGMVHRAYPDYVQSKVDGFDKMYSSFAGGKDKDQIEALNTTVMHAARFYRNAQTAAAAIPGTKAYVDTQQDRQQLLEEVNSAYTNGVLHGDKRDKLEIGLNSIIPSLRQEAAKEVMGLLGDKALQKQRTFQRNKPTSSIPDFELISPESQSDFQFVTGQKIGTNGIPIKSSNQQASPTPSFSHVSSDGKWGWNGSAWVGTGK